MALYDSQREWQHGQARGLACYFSRLQIPPTSVHGERDGVLNTCNLGAPHPLPNSVNSPFPTAGASDRKINHLPNLPLSSPSLRPSPQKTEATEALWAWALRGTRGLKTTPQPGTRVFTASPAHPAVPLQEQHAARLQSPSRSSGAAGCTLAPAFRNLKMYPPISRVWRRLLRA